MDRLPHDESETRAGKRCVRNGRTPRGDREVGNAYQGRYRHDVRRVPNDGVLRYPIQQHWHKQAKHQRLDQKLRPPRCAEQEWSVGWRRAAVLVLSKRFLRKAPELDRAAACQLPARKLSDRKSTRLNSSHL